MLPGPGPAPSRNRASWSGTNQDVEADEAQATPPATPTSGSAEPSIADVESASLTDVETQSSTVDPTEDEITHAAATEQILAKRWQCDLCFEPHLQHETAWRLGDDGCGHSLCRRCVKGCVQWGGRCPYDSTPIPPIVVCGVMGTDEYVYHEKQAEARLIGGIMCSATDCPGVAPSVEGAMPRPVRCRVCSARHCGRRICGVPWSEGHRCWDIVEEERRRQDQDAERWLRTMDSRIATVKRRLASGPRFRPCPQCGAMVEHVGGCNMVYHDSCRTRWCFACRRIGTCTDFDCRAPGSGPPTPRLRAAPAPAPVARKIHKAAMRLVTVAAVFIAVCACIGLQCGAPKSGFLNVSSSVPALASTCQTAFCSSSVASNSQPQSLQATADAPQLLEAKAHMDTEEVAVTGGGLNRTSL